MTSNLSPLGNKCFDPGKPFTTAPDNETSREKIELKSNTNTKESLLKVFTDLRKTVSAWTSFTSANSNTKGPELSIPNANSRIGVKTTSSKESGVDCNKTEPLSTKLAPNFTKILGTDNDTLAGANCFADGSIRIECEAVSSVGCSFNCGNINLKKYNQISFSIPEYHRVIGSDGLIKNHPADFVISLSYKNSDKITIPVKLTQNANGNPITIKLDSKDIPDQVNKDLLLDVRVVGDGFKMTLKNIELSCVAKNSSWFGF